jgi:hypothetical protein
MCTSARPFVLFDDSFLEEGQGTDVPHIPAKRVPPYLFCKYGKRQAGEVK